MQLMTSSIPMSIKAFFQEVPQLDAKITVDALVSGALSLTKNVVTLPIALLMLRRLSKIEVQVYILILKQYEKCYTRK